MFLYQTPFFWAGISLIGVIGANTAVNTQFGNRNPVLGLISGILFSVGRIVMVLPFVIQPRFPELWWSNAAGWLVLLASLCFLIPGLKSQPFIAPSKKLGFETKGLYGFVRHPFYLGELLFSLALSLLFRSWVGIALTPLWWFTLIIHVIHAEEKLDKEFGPFYLEYKNHVRGRIIPLPPFKRRRSAHFYPFKNLVFRGGGMKGTAYTGVLQVLDEEGILKQIKRVAGTSAGAITATLVSFNLDINHTLELIKSLDFKQVPQLKAESMESGRFWLPKFIGKEVSKITGDLGAIQRLMTRYGWYSSEYFYQWMRSIIAEQCNGNENATFQDFKNLGYKDLYIVGVNIVKIEPFIFSAETTPKMAVADAVRISMSIPLYFEVMQFDGETCGKGEQYVDGGLLLNYPLHIFDNPVYKESDIWFRDGINWETLGFYLYNPSDRLAKTNKIDNFREFISHLYESYNISQQIAEIENNAIDRRRSVLINIREVSATDFHLTYDDEKLINLIEEGKIATRNFLENFQSFFISNHKKD